MIARGRLRSSGMNRTEEAYHDLLFAAQRTGGIIRWFLYEGITLKLGPDTRYTPDFAVMLQNGELEMHEVKGGFRREDSWQKLKIAAGMFPFRFYLCTKANVASPWDIQEV